MTRSKDLYDFSLVIACYGDAPHLFANVSALARLFRRTNLVVEFILVEDASPLGDAAEVKRCIDALAGGPIAATAIYHPRNRGRGRSVQDGFEVARGTVVGYIDIDLEHSPDALIPMVLDCLEGVCDGYIGVRVMGDGAATWLRRFLSAGYKRMVHWVLPLVAADSEAGLKVFRREPLLPVLPRLEDEAWFWDTELVYRAGEAGLRLRDREIIFRKIPDKKSTVRLVRDVWIYLRTLAAFARKVRLQSGGQAAQPNKVSAHGKAEA